MTTIEEARKAAQAKKQQAPREDQEVASPTREEKATYINTVTFSGRLTKDVEYNMVGKNDREVAKSSLAVFNPGNEENKAMFFDLDMWLKERADDKGPANTQMFEEFLQMKKGEQVVVSGRLTMRMYKGITYYKITIQDIG